MDTATVLSNQQQVVREQEQPPQKPLEGEMFEEVRKLYMATMETNSDFRGELNLDWFKHHFATVAHKHKIVHYRGVAHPTAEQQESRDRYNMYLGLVRQRLSTWLKWRAADRCQQRIRQVTLPKTPTGNVGREPILNHRCPPTQLSLFGSGSHVPAPDHVRRFAQALHERVEGTKK